MVLINTACRNYFHLIRHPLEEGRKRPEKILTALAILSCVTVIVPAAVGALYGISSLMGRVKKSEVHLSIHATSSDTRESSEPLSSSSTSAVSESIDDTEEQIDDTEEQIEKFASHHNLPVELLKRWDKAERTRMYEENIYSQTAQFLRDRLCDVQVSFLESRNFIVLERGENKLVLLPLVEVGRTVFPPIEEEELEKLLERIGKVVYLVGTMNERASQPIPLTCYGTPAIYLKKNRTKNEAENLEVVLQQLKEIFA